MWTVPLVLVLRTVSPSYTDFVGLNLLASLVVVRLDVVTLPTLSPCRLWLVVCWAGLHYGIKCGWSRNGKGSWGGRKKGGV